MEVADEGVEGLETEVAGAVAEALSDEAVDPGSEVEWVGHGSALLGIGTFVLLTAGFGSGGGCEWALGVGVDGGEWFDSRAVGSDAETKPAPGPSHRIRV